MPLHVEQMLRMRKSWSFGCSIASRPGGDEQRWKRGYASHGEPRFIPPQHSLQTTKALIWFARLVGGEIDSIVFFVFKAAPLRPGRIWPLAMGTHLWIGCTATQCSFGQNSGLCRTNCSFCRKFVTWFANPHNKRSTQICTFPSFLGETCTRNESSSVQWVDPYKRTVCSSCGFMESALPVVTFILGIQMLAVWQHSIEFCYWLLDILSNAVTAGLPYHIIGIAGILSMQDTAAQCLPYVTHLLLCLYERFYDFHRREQSWALLVLYLF